MPDGSDTTADRSPERVDWITAAEAAEVLGVKRETIYAYVSRGLLDRRVAADGKTSLFDRTRVDALRGRRRRAPGELPTVVSSAITRIDDDVLAYRGRSVADLVADGVIFEDVAWWLWTGRDAAPGRWMVEAATLEVVEATVGHLAPDAPVIDRLRIATAVASSRDPFRHDLTRPTHAGPTLLAALVASLPRRGGDVAPGGPLAARLWSRLTTRPAAPATGRMLDAALVLLADHDLAASTFAARVAASTRADPYSVVTAGLGALGGLLHGAASRLVHELFAEAERRGSASAAVAAQLGRDGTLPGFGHVVYRRRDPRFVVLDGLVRTAYRRDPRLALVLDVHELATERTDAIPNIDLALGALTFLADMPPDAGEAIFAIARTAGWVAHATEEYAEPPLRFRPTSRPR